MGLPTKPTLDYSYTAFQQSQGDNAFPGTEIDNDHANLKLSIDETIDFLTGSFRSDGVLKASSYPGAEDLNAYVGTATAAAVSATASEVAAVAALDAFTDLYLGAKAADPALDNDGGALQDGALYWNTVAKEMRAYDLGGAAWITLLADMPEATFKMRAAGTGTGAPINGTATQVKTALALAKADVGLGNVDNTSDADKPVSTDTQTALDAKANTADIAANKASVADYRSNVADKDLLTNVVHSAAAEVTLTDAATIAVDMATFINAVVALAGNRTLGNPTNTISGRTGCIRIVQDATGSRTLAYGSNWKFSGGAPVLTTTAGATDLLFYRVISSTFIFASLVKGVA